MAKQIQDTKPERDGRLRHIAFIMDGNGRWATKRMLPREAGHKFGADTFRKIIRYCSTLGLEYVTVYAFSTENWKRPEKEVNSILSLLESFLDRYEKEVIENELCVRFVGDLSPIRDTLRDKIISLEEKTKHFSRVLNIALNYGGRDEIVHACNQLIAEGKREITAEDISSRLYTAGCPDPDLIIRTAGEKRLSNFLLWQSAYAELYCTDVLWPDFTPKDVDLAIRDFYSRKRRYGGV